MKFESVNGTLKISEIAAKAEFELHFEQKPDDLPHILGVRRQYEEYRNTLTILGNALTMYERGQAPNYENATKNIIHIQRQIGELARACIGTTLELKKYCANLADAFGQLNDAEKVTLCDYLIYEYLSLNAAEKKT